MLISHCKTRCEQLDISDFIGVVSNKCGNIGAAPWSSLVDCYGISGKKSYVYLGTSDNFATDTKYKTNLKRTDIVTIELDCKLHELSFKLKEVELIYGPIKIPLREAWYSAVSLHMAKYGDKYKCKFIPYEQY